MAAGNHQEYNSMEKFNYMKNDGFVRGAKLRAGKSYMERAIQQLYPLELLCDRQMPAPQAGMNPEAAPYRPRRDAAVAARLRLQEITQEEV